MTLLRELARRGVIHYFLAPADPGEIARAICDLHADLDRSRVVAVVALLSGKVLLGFLAAAGQGVVVKRAQHVQGVRPGVALVGDEAGPDA